MKKRCPFCRMNRETRLRILEKTKHFIILSDIGPIVPGHLLLIPRKHIRRLSEIYKEKYKEMEQPYSILKKKIISFLTEHYGAPIIFEHGGAGQTVFHAHGHFIPTSKPLFEKVLKRIREEENKLLQNAKKYHRKAGDYLYLEEDSRGLIISGLAAPPGFLREVIADLLGVPERGDWTKVTDGQKIVKEVKKKWRK